MANPPITIGPFTNVPAPGSPIRSDWAQQITNFVWANPRVAVNGTGVPTNKVQIVAANVVVTTNAGANATVPFVTAFGAPPVVLVSPGSFTAGQILMIGDPVTTTGFSVAVLDHAGTPQASASVRIMYVAIGSAP